MHDKRRKKRARGGGHPPTHRQLDIDVTCSGQSELERGQPIQPESEPVGGARRDGGPPTPLRAQRAAAAEGAL